MPNACGALGRTVREKRIGAGLPSTTVQIVDRPERAELSERLRRSVTWDQGEEMIAHEKLTSGVLGEDVQVYFFDRRSLWQCAVNENTNGLPRQGLPRVWLTPDL